jgi:hypothetical protein
MSVRPARSRRLAAFVACLGIPALIALLPLQAAFADTSPTNILSTTTTTVKSATTSGLGMSTFTSKTTAGTTKPASTSSGSDCSGNVACTDGVTLDSNNGLAVCSLYVFGNALQSPSNGCDNGTTSTKGNLALAVGRTDVNSALVSGSSTDPLVEADTCGIALALDQGSGSTAKVVCGNAPGLGSSSVDLGNVMAVLGPSYASLSQGGDLSADVCGAAAALGMDDTKTNVDVYCETLASATNWQASVPATTASVGDDLLSADVQKTFVFVNLSQGVAVTVCDVNVGLLGSQLLDTGQVNVALPPGTGPTVNCTQDANENPIIANGPVNLAVGDTGAGGGVNEGGGSGGTCGAGGGASQGGPASTTNSCGTTTPPPGYTTVPGPSNGAIANGDIAIVLGQNNANAGPNSGPGGTNDFGLNGNACGGAGSGGGTGASVKCQQFSYVKSAPTQTSVQGAHVTKPATAAGPEQLAKTGFPLISGLLGLILIAIGGIEMMRRRSEEASA